MRLKPLILPLVLALYAAFSAQPALADYKAGDVIVRLGASYVEPDNKRVISRDFLFTVEDAADPPVLDPVPVGVATQVRLGDDTTWFVSGVWLFHDHFGLELHHINNAKHSARLSYAYAVSGGGTGGEVVGLGSFKSYITSLFVNWYPVCNESWIQPYVGLGINYTNFDEDRLRPVFRDRSNGFTDGRIGLGSSFRWAAQIGVDVLFGRDSNWLANASLMYVESDPRLELGFDFVVPAADGVPQDASLPVRIRRDMDYDPWIFNLGIGYKFSF